MAKGYLEHPVMRTRRLKPSPALAEKLKGYGPGPFGKLKRIGRNLYATDASYHSDGSLHLVNVALVQDHPALPHLGALPDAPKAILTPYRKSNRIKYTMARDTGPFMRDMGAAEEAWGAYWNG